jgi:FKBP-type peptidyl-prolyl cis-trans isomerase
MEMKMRKYLWAGTATLVLAAALVAYVYFREPRTVPQKMGYVIGLQVAASLREQGVPIDGTALGSGVADGMNGAAPRLSKEELEEALRLYQTAAQQAAAERAGENLKAVEAFLRSNSLRKEVKSTASGLQYEILKGSEGESVLPGAVITANFNGKLMNGTEIESSAKAGHPVEIRVDQMIPGLKEGLLLMKAGSIYRFYLPPSLAYGNQARPGVPPNSLLIYEVEAVQVKTAPAASTGKKRKS